MEVMWLGIRERHRWREQRLAAVVAGAPARRSSAARASLSPPVPSP